MHLYIQILRYSEEIIILTNLFIELRCHDRFGGDFYYSSLLARILVTLPEAVDALAIVGKRRGQRFLDFFGEVMTGVKPKTSFFDPLLLLALSVETIRQIFVQRLLRYQPLVPPDIGVS